MKLNFEKAKLWVTRRRCTALWIYLISAKFCFGINLLYGLDDLVKLVNAATGWSTTLWELMQLGERRINTC